MPSKTATVRSPSYTVTRYVPQVPFDATRSATATSLPGWREVMDMDGDCRVVGGPAVGGDPEGMIGKRKDRTAVGYTVRVAFPVTVHLHPGIPVPRIGDMHPQQPAKPALLELRDAFFHGDRCGFF